MNFVGSKNGDLVLLRYGNEFMVYKLINHLIWKQYFLNSMKSFSLWLFFYSKEPIKLILLKWLIPGRAIKKDWPSLAGPNLACQEIWRARAGRPFICKDLKMFNLTQPRRAKRLGRTSRSFFLFKFIIL